MSQVFLYIANLLITSEAMLMRCELQERAGHQEDQVTRGFKCLALPTGLRENSKAGGECKQIFKIWGTKGMEHD